MRGRTGKTPSSHPPAVARRAPARRERLVLVRAAEGRVRDTARFALEVEAAPPEWAAAHAPS